MAGLTHHFLLNPLVGQPFLGSEGEDGHDKIKAKRYGSGSGWSALYDLLESILAPRSNAGCRPSERQKIEAVSDVLITNDNIGEADNDEMAKVAASYWQLHPEVDDTPASAAMVKEWLKFAQPPRGCVARTEAGPTRM
jgi:hypothetical protein